MNLNYNYYFTNYFNNYITIKSGLSSILVINYLNFSFNNFNNFLIILKKKLLKNKNLGINNVNNLINCLFLSFYLKDSFILLNSLTKILELIFYKYHRKVIVLLRYLFKYFTVLFSFFNILGVLLKIKGKIGLGGNSKKKRLKLIFNKLKLNNKKIKLCLSNAHARTDSGSLGISYLLTYN